MSFPDVAEPIFEDQDLWVFDNPAGLPLLRDQTDRTCLWDVLKARGKPYLVHRLDKGTSGCLIVAKTQAAQSALTREFAARRVHKFYIAAVQGQFPATRTQAINLPLCKGRKSRYRVAGLRETINYAANCYSVAQDREGVDALSLARTVPMDRTGQPNQNPSKSGVSILVVKPRTGRTHQIRVHLAWIGFPILGDYLYGKPQDPKQARPRLMLHCHKLSIPDGRNFFAPLPEDFTC